MPGIDKSNAIESDNRSAIVRLNGSRDVLPDANDVLQHEDDTLVVSARNIKEPVDPLLLPVDGYRLKLLSEFDRNETCIVVAETGSGKTTRIPQFVVAHGLERLTGPPDAKHKQIIITQPRRLAAITVAERVAQEMGCRLGEEVGYCVRFDEMYTRRTKIVYMTDGMLMRKMREDPNLEHCGMLIIDEVHERSVNTDILVGCARRIQKQRRRKPSADLTATSSFQTSSSETSRVKSTENRLTPLKLVLMSATMDVDNFKNYFVGCRVLYLEGRQFPVQVRFTSDDNSVTTSKLPASKMLAVGDVAPSRISVNGNSSDCGTKEDGIEATADDGDDYFHKTLAAIFQIHLEFPNDGDILVFLTGADEINAMCKRCRSIAHQMPTTHSNAAPVQFMQLYASLPKEKQEELFRPRKSPPLSTCATTFARRVILSTNVAETSVTIPNIKYVIDTGKAKVRQRLSETAVERLSIVDISQASAMQRAGRSGRQQPGFCFRLYSQSSYDKRELYTKPEILRCGLSSVVMQMLALKLRRVSRFSFLDRPPDESFEHALRELWWLGAIDQIMHTNKDASDSGAVGGEIDGDSGGSLVSITSSSSSRSSSMGGRRHAAVAATSAAGAPESTSNSTSSSRAPVSRMQLKWSLSAFGKRMAALPVEPRYAACIVHSLQMKCTEEVIVIIAMLSAEGNVFLTDDNRNSADTTRSNTKATEDEFNCFAGDLTSMLKVWRLYCQQKPGHRKDWCYDKRINPYSMLNAARIREQLRQLIWNTLPKLQSISVQGKSSTSGSPYDMQQILLPHSNDLTVIRRCLCKGLFMNAAVLNQQFKAGRAVYETVDRRYTTIKIHPSSVLAPHSSYYRRNRQGSIMERAPPKCIVFVELVQSNELYARSCILADEKWLEEDERCAGYYRESRDIMLQSNQNEVRCNQTRDI